MEVLSCRADVSSTGSQSLLFCPLFQLYILRRRDFQLIRVSTPYSSYLPEPAFPFELSPASLCFASKLTPSPSPSAFVRSFEDSH